MVLEFYVPLFAGIEVNFELPRDERKLNLEIELGYKNALPDGIF